MDNGKENGNYKDYRDYIGVIGYILGLYRDNGKENGNYHNGSYRVKGCVCILTGLQNLVSQFL